jgi:3-phosphoshikimate 1-carboxyvinyltransferase
MTLPGDFSAAAFLMVAALITPDSSIVIRNVGLNSTRTGLLDALLAMGGDICISNPLTRSGEPVGDLSVRYSELHGISIRGEQVVRMIDEFPVFAVAAAFATGETRVEDALELRNKESDRISALCQELRTLGVQADEKPDGFSIQGGLPLSGGVTRPHGDHRLAMSLAVAGLAARSPLTVTNAEIINESFPEFIQSIQSLGGNLALEPQNVR